MCQQITKQTKLIVREMAEMLVLDLASKNLVTDQIVLTIGYDKENLSDSARMKKYRGEFYLLISMEEDIPKHAHGTVNLGDHTASTSIIVKAVLGVIQNRG